MANTFSLLFRRASTNPERIAQCKALSTAFAALFVGMMLVLTIVNHSGALMAAVAGMMYALSVRFASAQETYQLRQELESKLEELRTAVSESQAVRAGEVSGGAG